MNRLIDCDVLEYCRITDEKRNAHIEHVVDIPVQPSHTLPVFELCRALHLLFRNHNFPPLNFRKCWAEFSANFWNYGVHWLHVSEYPEENLAREIRRLPKLFEGKNNVPCEGSSEMYWSHHFMLTQRLRYLCKSEPWDEDQRWSAIPPDGKEKPIKGIFSNSDDIVMDTNNLLELLNQLPEDGMGSKVNEMHFPNRLCQNAIRLFKRIIYSYGATGKFIVPISALEEADRVANYDKNREKYERARKVIHAMSINVDLPLWNIFDFQSLTQEIFDCFQELYEALYSPNALEQSDPGLGDTLVIAHGIYNQCPIASTEWFEKPDWAAVAQVFPYLVLKDD